MSDSPLLEVKPDAPKGSYPHNIWNGSSFEACHEVRLQGQELTLSDGLSEISWEEVAVEDCVFQLPPLLSLQWQDVWVDRCRLYNLQVRRGDFLRLQMDHCAWIGAQLNTAQWRHVRLRDCRMEYWQLRQGLVKEVQFVRCQFAESDWAGTEFERVSFEDCDLTAADFSHAKLKHVSFRGSNLSGIKLDVVQLNKTVEISQMQAFDLLHLLRARIVP